MPQKQRFLELPPERQKAIVREFQLLFYWLTFIILVAFVMIQIGSYLVASREHGEWLIMAAAIVIMTTPLITVIVQVVRTSTMMKES